MQYCIVTFGSLSSWINQLSNSHRQVGFKIVEHLIARGYDIFQNEHVFIRDLSYLTLQIIFDAWWASMKVNSKRPIARNTSGHALLLRFHLHCGFEETGRPGIIYIVCHRVLRHPLEHGTSSMGIHLLAKAHIAQ